MPKVKSTNSIQFWYPITAIGQLTFEGKTVFHDAPQEGHILYQGRLICKQSMERLKNECAAKKQKIATQRIPGVRICELCQQGYKEIKGTNWDNWVNGKELKKEATVRLNPELLHGVKTD